MMEKRALAALRIAVSTLLFIHGSSRLLTHGVPPFEEFFAAHHMPGAGAWVVTMLEIIGTPMLALGLWTRYLAFYFAGELTIGVILVHARNGWFVVGGGTNGMEYSVLLISVLLAVAYAARGAGERRSP